MGVGGYKSPYNPLIQTAGTRGIVRMQNLITFRHQNSSTGNPMIQATMAQPGDPARNFSLKDQNDKTFDLYEQAQKRVLLSFTRLHGRSSALPR